MNMIDATVDGKPVPYDVSLAALEHPRPTHHLPRTQGRPMPGPRGYPLIGVLPEILRDNSALPALKKA